jgi:hypothetical protein
MLTRRGGRGCRAQRERLPLHFYQLIEGEERRALEDHLARCADCAGAWQETRRALAAVDTRAAFPHETEVDWTGFARATVARAQSAHPEAAGVEDWAAPPAWRGSPVRHRFAVAGGLLAAAATLIVLIGIRQRAGTVPDLVAPPPGSPVLTAGADAARMIEAGVARRGAARYLRDSGALLVELVQAPARCRRSDGTLDIALEKERAISLLRRKNLYLDALGGPRDQRLLDLMRQLETVLLQLSSLEDCAGARQIHDLRAEIEERQILLRIDLIAREVEGGAARA